jgi:hypothetical protein
VKKKKNEKISTIKTASKSKKETVKIFQVKTQTVLLYKLEKTTKEPPNSAKQTHNIA